MNLPEKVELIEVCPRDGFQNVHDIIPFDAKVAIIKKLAEAGFKPRSILPGQRHRTVHSRTTGGHRN